MQDNIQQDDRMNELFVLLKGQGYIESKVGVVETTELIKSDSIDNFVISENQCKIMQIDNELCIKQWRVKGLRRDFQFKSMQTLYYRILQVLQLKYTKNQNYFYYTRSKFQTRIRFMQINNGKVKQISKMSNESWFFVRQIFVDDENFVFIAIPKFIQQYCKYTKKLLQIYSIENEYGQDCFDYCTQEKLLVSQDSKNINVWFIKENLMINRKYEAEYFMNKHIKLNKRQIYILRQGTENQGLMLLIYQITQDNKEIILITSKQIDNFIQYICKLYSMENVYKDLQNYHFISWNCQTFSILQKDSQYKFLAIMRKQIQREFQQYNK